MSIEDRICQSLNHIAELVELSNSDKEQITTYFMEIYRQGVRDGSGIGEQSNDN